MNAEIIAIGSELTSGAKLDTNSQWLSLALSELGISTVYHSAVADDHAAMTLLFRDAMERSDLVLITGGLGPTLDDITRQALAAVVGGELVLHEPSLQRIREMFARRDRPMPERNVIQAMFPQGSEPIRNSRGTAPGIWLETCGSEENDACTVIALPGVPSEMKSMFEQEVRPRLPRGQRVIQRLRMNCFGIGESTAEEMLGDLTARGRDPEIGITVHEATITLRITAQGGSPQNCRGKIAAANKKIRAIMGEIVFGEEDEELEHVVTRMLRERGLSLAAVESGTGGLLAYRLSNCGESSQCFRGGFVVPDSVALQRIMPDLDGDPAFVVWNSSAAAAKLAESCRHQFGTNFVLAITECPALDPEETDGTVPQTFIALSGEDGTDVHKHSLFGDPAITKSRAVKAALNLLRLHLLR